MPCLGPTNRTMPVCCPVSDGVWGRCARLGLLDIRVRRNAFGSQVDSFEALLSVPRLDPVAPPEQRGQPFPGVFIRAP